MMLLLLLLLMMMMMLLMLWLLSLSLLVNSLNFISRQVQQENMQQQQQQQDEAPVSSSPESICSSLPVVPLTTVTVDSHDPNSPTQRYHSDPHDGDVTTEEPDKTFIDEMDVDKYVWNFMLYNCAESLEHLSSEYCCGFRLRRSFVDVHGRTQYRLQVTASTQTGLSSAYDALTGLIANFTDANVTRQKVHLCPREYFDELKHELQKNDILLMSSGCYLVGPASALDAAQSVVSAAVDEIYARKSPPFAISIDDPGRDIFLFHIPLVDLTVHVRQGMQRLLRNNFGQIADDLFLV